MAKTSRTTKSSAQRAKRSGSKSKSPVRKMEEAELFELFEHGLKDILWAEKALTKVIPRMIRKAVDGNLKKALEKHLRVTNKQVDKLNRVFKSIDVTPRAKKCSGMEGIIKEGAEMMEEFNNNLIDAGIIAAGSKVEHYEISSYTSLITLAESLELEKAVQILREILEEEMEADQVLQSLAKNISQRER